MGDRVSFEHGEIVSNGKMARWMNGGLFKGWQTYPGSKLLGFPSSNQIDLGSQFDCGGAINLPGQGAEETVIYRSQTDKTVIFPRTVFDHWVKEGGPSGNYGWPLGRARQAVYMQLDGKWQTVYDYCFNSGLIRFTYESNKIMSADHSIAGAAYVAACGKF